MARTIARLVDSPRGPRLVPTSSARSQLLRSVRLLRRLASCEAADSPQRQAASRAAALVSRYVQEALGADVSGETIVGKEQALPRGDRT